MELTKIGAKMKSYKDFMEGYVASADRKPAKDGRMLPARKIQTNDRPDDKEVAEKMDMKKADMGDVIKDFQDSDAPQFKGKSKEKRREMAIAAKLSAEELSAKQKKIDKNNNGKIDGADLAKLRGEETEMDEEMTPAQKAARLQLIKKSAAKMNKRAEMDAKRAMRSDPVLGRRKSDPADHDLVHKEDTHVVKYHDAQGNHKNDSKPMTQDKARAHAAKGNAIDKVGGKYTVHKINEGGPGSGRVSSQDVKQGIGIARDKRYAGGNMTGAVKAMDKLKKGISSHPAVKKELQKQNEDAKPIKENNEMEKKEMMKTQLHFIKYAADEIIEYIDMGGEIEEWYQNKVSKATSDFEGLHAYMEGTARKTGLKEEELDSQESDVDYDRKPTFAEFISKLNK